MSKTLDGKCGLGLMMMKEIIQKKMQKIPVLFGVRKLAVFLNRVCNQVELKFSGVRCVDVRKTRQGQEQVQRQVQEQDE